jgi:hypothetical protein
MTDPMAKACINMKGVLRSLTYLCSLDAQAADTIKNADITVQFSIKNGPAVRLKFDHGVCTFADGKGSADIKLYFSTPEKFNALMDGNGMPTILKGFTKLNFLLKDFMKLSDRLAYFLRPDPEAVQDDRFREISTLLTFYTAFNALPEIGMHDPVGAQVIRKAADGQLCVSIEGTEHAVRMKVKKSHMGILSASDGSPEMYLKFSDIGEVGDVLNGRTDFLTAVGLGGVRLGGYIPVMMSVEHLVPLLGVYLK